MKNFITIVFLTIISFSTFSQNSFSHKIGDTIYYQNNRATYLKTDVFVIIKAKNDSADHFEVEKFLTDFKIKKTYLSSRFVTDNLQNLRGNGNYKSFHRNGKIAVEGNLVKGKRGEGTWTYWHENGQKKMEEELSKETFFTEKRVPLIINFWDKTGNQTAANGNGSCEYKDEESKLLLNGSVKKGLKNGLWTATKENKVVYEETYKKGKLVKGVSFNTEGNRFPYKKVFEEAYYQKEGVDNVRKYIGDNIKSEITRITGVIITTFNVSIKGEISNVSVKRGLTGDYNREVKRIISEMNTWVPAKDRGINVASKYTLTLSVKE